jgi:tetratricopeptide (TPR) repeat protein
VSSGSSDRDRWFRNKEWSDEIAEAFRQRLARARRKAQYLRIQALYLIECHPEAALDLLEQYFKTGDEFDVNLALLHKGAALTNLGDITGAVAAYEEALAWETSRYSQKTQAYLDYPSLIVSRGLDHLYARAMQILQEHEDRPVFPVEHFRAAALRAVLLERFGQPDAARAFARAALAAAAEQKSGFRYHQNLGLVSAADRELVEQVARLLGNELN